MLLFYLPKLTVDETRLDIFMAQEKLWAAEPVHWVDIITCFKKSKKEHVVAKKKKKFLESDETD